MKLALLILLGSWVSCFALTIDPSRPHLDSLPNRGRMQWDDYQDDFILSQSAEIIDTSAEDLIRRLQKHHSVTTLPFRSSISVEGKELTPKALSYPAAVFSEDQVEGLKECRLEKCSFKFNLRTETPKLIKATDKVTEAKDLIYQRLNAYLTHKTLLGYETRDDNVPYAKKALALTGFMAKRYPKTFAYLSGPFWARDFKAGGAPKRSYLRSELFAGKGSKMQAVYRLTENLEFQEGGYVNVEIHIYTNHYFDSSMRVFEVFPYSPDKKRSVLVVTDLSEIDELKKSDLIRTLFRNRMEEALAFYRTEEIKQLR